MLGAEESSAVGCEYVDLRGLKDEWRSVHQSEPNRHTAFA